MGIMRAKVFLSIIGAICLFIFSQMGYARHAAILVEAESGAVLHEMEAAQAWYPASLTKLMTLYMTFDALSNKQMHLHDVMYTSKNAAQQPNSRLGLNIHESITVEQAILAIITRSANDASVVLAEHLAVTESNFAVRMTAKAHSLGMYNTYFMNATGLPNELQVTTAHDMALLALTLYHHFPEYYHYFSAHNFEFKGHTFLGINKFTANYNGAEGMKTGFTCNSGYNLVSSAQQHGKRLIGVILGGHSSNERYQLMINQMDHGFAGDYASVANIHTMSTYSSGMPPRQLDCALQEHHYEEHEQQRFHSREPRYLAKRIKTKGKSRLKKSDSNPHHVRH